MYVFLLIEKEILQPDHMVQLLLNPPCLKLKIYTHFQFGSITLQLCPPLLHDWDLIIELER